MKPFLPRSLCVMVLGLLLAAWPALAADNPFRPKLPFKSAIIKYEMRGSQQGKATLYIQGETSARHEESSMTMMGMKQARKGITITTPDKVVEVDLVAKKATATGNMATYMAQQYEKLGPAEQATVRQNAEKMGTALAGQFMGGKPQVKQGTFKGKPAQIVTMGGMTTYNWKDTPITLKTEGSVMGMRMDQEAVSIETDVAVPASALQVPAGIQVVFDQEADRMQRTMAQNMVNMLKDPQFESKMGQGQGGPMGGMIGGMLQGMDKDGDGDARDPGVSDQDQPQGMPQGMPENMEDLLKQMKQGRGN